MAEEEMRRNSLWGAATAVSGVVGVLIGALCSAYRGGATAGRISLELRGQRQNVRALVKSQQAQDQQIQTVLTGLVRLQLRQRYHTTQIGNLETQMGQINGIYIELARIQDALKNGVKVKSP